MSYEFLAKITTVGVYPDILTEYMNPCSLLLIQVGFLELSVAYMWFFRVLVPHSSAISNYHYFYDVVCNSANELAIIERLFVLMKYSRCYH